MPDYLRLENLWSEVQVIDLIFHQGERELIRVIVICPRWCPGVPSLRKHSIIFDKRLLFVNKASRGTCVVILDEFLVWMRQGLINIVVLYHRFSHPWRVVSEGTFSCFDIWVSFQLIHSDDWEVQTFNRGKISHIPLRWALCRPPEFGE